VAKINSMSKKQKTLHLDGMRIHQLQLEDVGFTRSVVRASSSDIPPTTNADTVQSKITQFVKRDPDF
jgi:hypothetical protein